MAIPPPEPTDEPDGEPLDDLRRQLQERDARIEALEQEIRRRTEAEAAARARRFRLARFAGEVAIKAVAGTNVAKAAEESWDAWEAYLGAPTERPVPKKATRNLAVAVLARLLRLRLLLLIAGMVGGTLVLLQTVLLYQQNQRFDRQNNLIAFEQTSNLRDLLFIPPYDSLGQPVPDYHAIPRITLYDESRYTWSQPSTSTVEQILAFARREPEIVGRALLPLVQDEAPPVAIGALQVLGRLRREGLFEDRISAPQTRFRGADLRGVDLSEADFRQVDFSNADLREAILSGSDLRQVKFVGTDLRGADLSYSHLESADFSEADLSMISANGSEPFSLTYRGIDLRGAYMTLVVLSGKDLRYANLRNAYLLGADLSHASLSEADLSGAILYSTNLNEADLRQVRGWQNIEAIDKSTIYSIQAGPEFIQWALSSGATADSLGPSRPSCEDCAPDNPPP